jgi:hypothetical protein
MPNNFREIINKLEKQKAAIERALSALREVEDTDRMEAPRRGAQEGQRETHAKR